MEELVNKLAELQAERKAQEDQADNAVREMGYNRSIHDAEKELQRLKELRDETRYPFEWEIGIINKAIEDISARIIETWGGEKKTMSFDAGTLKFRTTGSLVIENDRLVLEGLLAHTSAKDVATNYISGFKKTAVKKFMGVLSLPMGAAWIDQKTTVKLEEEAEKSA